MATSAIARRINKTRVLQTLLENPLMSRAEVARDLRLTKSTLSSVVGSLLADDLILERELEAASGRVGRPGIRIELNASSAHFLGAEISPDGIKITALDLTAKQVGLVTRKLTDRSSPGATLDQLSQMVGELARQLAPQSQTMGMGVALPGFVNTEGVLVHAPRLLVLDEPFEAVDPVSARTIRGILEDFAASGGTVVLSSHVMELVERICTDVAILAGGVVRAAGSLDEVRAGTSLEDRFLALVGGAADVEGLAWLRTSSD